MLRINLNPLKEKKSDDHIRSDAVRGRKKNTDYLDMLNLGLMMNYRLNPKANNPIDYRKPGILGDIMRPEFDVARRSYSSIIGAHAAYANHEFAANRAKYLSTTSQ